MKILKFLRRYPEIIILTIAALATRMWALFSPASVVFDEVYFKAFAGNYLTGAYFFDIHPPVGKLLLAGWAALAGISPANLVSTTDPSVALRVLPALAGTLLVPLFYVFLRQLRASRKVATLGAVLLLLENALLVESRFILLDTMLLAFGLGAFTLFLAARHRSGRARLWLIVGSAALAGLAAGTKWTGLSALGLVGLLWLFDMIRRWPQFTWRLRLTEGLILVLLPAAIYLGSFWIHFQLLPNTGQGDAFMSQKFQSTIIGHPLYDSSIRMNFWEKFTDLNQAMVNAGESLKTATHPYGSEWTTWPLMQRDIYYWQGPAQSDGTQGNIYLLGNPVIWWGIPILILGGLLASSQAFGRLKAYRYALGALALGYALNLLPFSRIERVMFLYHYFMALILSLAFTVIMLGALAGWHKDGEHPWKFPSPLSRGLFFGLIGLALIGFIFFAPLTYGVPLSPADMDRRMWLPTWR